ncbi:MAG: energy transducer TonB [Candidatus Acidiferrum sp.]|jgi:protein TonB
MREPFLRSLSGKDSGNDSTHDAAADSWLNRVRENLAQLLIPTHFKPSSANGTPIHLLKFDKSLRPARAQGASFITHIAVFAGIMLLMAKANDSLRPGTPNGRTPPPVNISSAIIRTLTSADDGGGKGGNHNWLPPTNGTPPPRFPILLVRPTIPQNQNSALPVPPTISTAPVLTPTDRIGLPWMPSDTHSPGPGDGNGIGVGDGDKAGSGGPEEYGPGGSRGPYGVAATQPACAYCPYPTYTDEARHGKIQGSVTLQVLVGADGRAQDIRIVKGVGFGLDERAMETVRGWKFVPGRDAAKHPVTTWVTVEAVFRLY